MKTLLLELKLKSGLLTELQSDTIYGHFCWRLKEARGEDTLKKFIEAYRVSPVFTLSDGLLKIGDDIRFPNPLVFHQPDIPAAKKEKIHAFVKRKWDKEEKKISLKELQGFLNSGRVNREEKILTEEDKKKIRKPVEKSLRVSVQIDRNSFSSAEGKLYSYKPIHLSDNASFAILIKVIDDNAFKEYQCETLLKEVFTLGYGKKKSSGYGQFEIVLMKDFSELQEPVNANAFLTLGNYLPSEQDGIEPIGYEINAKYGRLGEERSLSENPFKNPIAFLTAGSCFAVKTPRPNYGRVTGEKEISTHHSDAVQFGVPFTLNFIR